jgi:DNA-binding HxlR family transcriptional regulator
MKKSEEFLHGEGCPVRNVLDRIGDKWSMLVITILGKQPNPMRFNELSGSIGDISQKMLTVTLRQLEADGLVSRHHYPEIPPRVEYALTDLGYSLLPHLDGLHDWAYRNLDRILETRRKFLEKKQVA